MSSSSSSEDEQTVAAVPVPVPEEAPIKVKKSKKSKKEKKKKKDKKKSKKKKKDKKSKKDKAASDDEGDGFEVVPETKHGRDASSKRKRLDDDGDEDGKSIDSHPEIVKRHKINDDGSSAPAAGGVDRCFLGNLSFKVTDDQIVEFFADCGEVVQLDYITDKATGNFYGSAFVIFETPEGAEKAEKKNGTDFLERPIKVRRAPMKEGQTKVFSALNKKDIFKNKPLSAKPDGCTKLFLGNLSFQIEDDNIHEFFKECGVIAGIRWLSHRDTGDFKGCGFVTFLQGDAVDKAVLLNGSDLLGRAIRIDYSE
jgi:nucleolin